MTFWGASYGCRCKSRSDFLRIVLFAKIQFRQSYGCRCKSRSDFLRIVLFAKIQFRQSYGCRCKSRSDFLRIVLFAKIQFRQSYPRLDFFRGAAHRINVLGQGDPEALDTDLRVAR